MKSEIIRNIEKKLQCKIVSSRSVGGGCINDAQTITTSDNRQYFLKMNLNSANDMFFKEANGLLELKKASAIRVPEVILVDTNFILLEQINTGRKSKTFDEDFGRSFANLHQFTSEHFGFYEDNYIGSTPQKNIPDNDEKNNWIKFYFNKRLLFQYKLLEKNGYADSAIKRRISLLENKIENILEGSENIPSLLHGDLWSGNYLVDENGNACLIDPAVYYGNREADLAMTKLFGGFSSVFYKSYQEVFPLPDGYEYRENIYKLYHIMNHLNLFGGGYYHQTISLMDYYL
ncbi:MAG: fructosamine kinase family protein [Ignavibacterium album]|uniref:fructosamine kinase family protein n=1 Tax=Ignavibacterium album TaxID=591197 RepID=UPI0026EE52AD|nr:fructosamine kinase family protein [Ignavibacterium album]MBI5663088.1 fructosamine kinase family protein [Ignavibacterium album]